MKKILLICYFNKNLGDDLFIKIIKERYPDYIFDCFIPEGTDSSFIKDNLGCDTIEYSKKMRVIDKMLFRTSGHAFYIPSIIKDYDYVLMLGGSLFIEHEGWKKIYLERKIIQKYARHFSVIGSNFGPYNSEKFLSEYREFFKKCDFVSVRDDFSKKILDDEKNHIINAEDFVMNLNTKKYEDNKEKILGISVVNIEKKATVSQKTKDNYRLFLLRMIQYYSKKGYRIQLFSFCEPEGDLEYCESIKNECTSINESMDVSVIPYNGEIDEFLKVYSKCEKVIATRFHSMILGWLFNQEVIPVAYSKKTENFIDSMDFSCQYLKLESINPKEFVKYDKYFNKINIDSLNLDVAKLHFNVFKD